MSHPHDDHIQDIERVIQYFKPRIVRRQHYDWDEVEGEQPEGDYENLHVYRDFQARYDLPVEEPNWGAMTVNYLGLTVDEAVQLNKAKFINNSSVMAVVTIGTSGTFKMVFPGDIENDDTG